MSSSIGWFKRLIDVTVPSVGIDTSLDFASVYDMFQAISAVPGAHLHSISLKESAIKTECRVHGLLGKEFQKEYFAYFITERLRDMSIVENRAVLPGLRSYVKLTLPGVKPVSFLSIYTAAIRSGYEKQPDDPSATATEHSQNLQGNTSGLKQRCDNFLSLLPSMDQNLEAWSLDKKLKYILDTVEKTVHARDKAIEKRNDGRKSNAILNQRVIDKDQALRRKDVDHTNAMRDSTRRVGNLQEQVQKVKDAKNEIEAELVSEKSAHAKTKLDELSRSERLLKEKNTVVNLRKAHKQNLEKHLGMKAEFLEELAKGDNPDWIKAHVEKELRGPLTELKLNNEEIVVLRIEIAAQNTLLEQLRVEIRGVKYEKRDANDAARKRGNQVHNMRDSAERRRWEMVSVREENVKLRQEVSNLEEEIGQQKPHA